MQLMSHEIFGICSRVKYAQVGYPETHFLLIDIDGDYLCLRDAMMWLIAHKIRTADFIVATKRGWHIFCFQRFTFQALRFLMPKIPHIDQKWVRIGLKRGYWFLWTRTAVIKPDGLSRYVTFMKVHVPESNEWMHTKMGCFSHPKTETCPKDAKDFEGLT